MKENRERSAERPLPKPLNLPQCPFQPFPPARFCFQPKPLPPNARPLPIIATFSSAIISSRILPFYFPTFISPSLLAIFYYHFIGGCYIIYAPWMWTKMLLLFVRYMGWNMAHNLYFPLSLLFASC